MPATTARRPRRPAPARPAVPLGYLRRMARKHPVPEHGEPDDLAADAAVLVLANLDRYDPARGSFGAFVYWQFRSARDRARRAAACRFGWSGDGCPDRVPARRPGPDAVAERAELLRLLVAALATLSPQDREVLTRRFGLDGNPPAKQHELAADGVTRQAAAARVERALDRLRATSPAFTAGW